ncbi:water stress/hypersensitive response domain-containing protein [Lysobacter alkalisoli]|uniref:Water stress/hypersensitive response domain-containing protein n=2 Tax=Marilutibacter alkalisoli TaxID=2591633 RepID=A0A514BWN5_9GAMM|nr:water stress/hypersensitive response domain-containing protein [Lysobacter alkalisoli]
MTIPFRNRPSLPGLRATAALLLAVLLGACASLPNRDPLNIDVAGIESLPGDGMELRLAVKLRVQNPNDSAVDYSGAALRLDLNGQRLATGVSNEAGTVPRYGETLVTIPVTVSALNVVRQITGLADSSHEPAWNYKVNGKLEGGLFGTRRFSGEGTLDLSRAP